jgi:hypothetical protein
LTPKGLRRAKHSPEPKRACSELHMGFREDLFSAIE